MAKASPDTESDGDNEKAEDVLEQAREDFARCREAWEDNHREAKDDIEFARLEKQWPDEVMLQRKLEKRPCLTFNKLPTFIRQVVNDARQNKPSVSVHPQDSSADKRTAQIYEGLIRNIEVTSDADIAYDTAIEHAVGQGFGFWRINTRYTCDDAFDQDIVIERIANPFTVYGDPRSTAGDSSDWNVAFITDLMSREDFEREYPDAEKVDWDHDFANCPEWLDGDSVIVAEYWTRKKVKREIVALSDGSVIDAKEIEKNPQNFEGLQVVGKPRVVETYKVTQRIMSGAEELKKVEWAGKYIPIVPVYGDEVFDEKGKRHLRSLIRSAKDGQRTYNYMRTTGIEGLALQPRIPYIGEEGAFDADPNWQTSNSQSHAYLEYAKGKQAPQRQPLPAHYSAAFQEALGASDDMKAVMGIYDPSLGARSNETSGRAIMARQREGDVSTFHFIDNLSRSVRHGGRIIIDLIPKVFSTERMIRTLGEDLKPESVQNVQVGPTGQAVAPQQDEAGNIIGHIYDLTVGKYDLTVSSGPSFTSRREEAAMQMQELIRAEPSIAPIIGDLYAKNLDWPGADEIAERLKRMVPPQALGEQGPQVPPEVQQHIAQQGQVIQQGQQVLQQQGQKLQEAQQQIAALNMQLQDKAAELQLKDKELNIKFIEAQTRRIDAEKPHFVKVPPTGVPGAA